MIILVKTLLAYFTWEAVRSKNRIDGFLEGLFFLGVKKELVE